MPTLNEFPLVGYRKSRSVPVNANTYLNPLRPISRREQLRRLWSAWEILYWKAVNAREKAISYRNYLVGAAGMVFKKDVYSFPEHWDYPAGMNSKPDRNGNSVCAERVLISSAIIKDFNDMLGLVVVGEPQEDDFSKKSPPTLHPCHSCREFMRATDIVKPHTRILTASPPKEGEKIKWEMHTFRQLLRYHGEI